MDLSEAKSLLPGLESAVWSLHDAGIYDGNALDLVIARRDEAASVLVDDFLASRVKSKG